MLNKITSTSLVLTLAVFGILDLSNADIDTNRNIDALFKDKSLDQSQIDGNAFLEEYEQKRKEIIEKEAASISGGDIVLTEKEQAVDDVFMKYKLMELSAGIANDFELAASLHFFEAESFIEQSYIYKFLKAMPKGAALQLHSAGSVSSKWVIGNLTYEPGMLQCLDGRGVTILTFRQDKHKHRCVNDYTLVADNRNAAKCPRDFDAELEKSINLYTPTPETDYPTINVVWNKFNKMFDTIRDVLNYLPAYKAYYWQMMEELYEDNVMGAELRINFKELYDADNNIKSVDEAIEIFIDLVEDFKKDHPNFIGIKLIYAAQHNVKGDALRATLNTFKSWHSKYPELIVGIDFVGQEDKGEPLHEFVDILHQTLPTTAKYFFSAGQTLWYGTTSDLNLVDALLMNTTRIGHAYSLMKHPLLVEEVKKRDICIEVSPIANQVLNLVWDLRSHPGSLFIARNLPMVISSNSPGFWGAKGLSNDFHSAIMSIAPVKAGLRTLKHFVYNSIKYSALSENGKTDALKVLQKTWDQFIDDVLDLKVF